MPAWRGTMNKVGLLFTALWWRAVAGWLWLEAPKSALSAGLPVTRRIPEWIDPAPCRGLRAAGTGGVKKVQSNVSEGR